MSNGTKEAIGEVVSGIVIASVFSSLLPLMGPNAWALYLIVFVSSVVLAYKLLTAEIIYLIGWFVGIWIISQGVMFSILDWIIYIIIPIIGLIVGLYLRFK